MTWVRLIYNQEMKEFLLEKLVEDGASKQAKREVTKPCPQQEYMADTVKLSVTLKFHASKYRYVGPIEVQRESLSDFCEELVEQRHQVGLKNNGRTKGVRNRDWKRKLYPNGSS